MGYLHIDNLYKKRDILAFKQVWCLEKIHGTSAHVRYSEEKGISFFAGGEKHSRFVDLFDAEALSEKLSHMGTVFIYGEAYGGKQQRMADTYGKDLKFVVFDVKINDGWLIVPRAAKLVDKLGLEFVHFELVDTEIETLDRLRDQPSVQAERNGMGVHDSEGIVLRPVFECSDAYGERIIAKYKREGFRETTTTRHLSDEELKVLEDANEIAEEWVTDMRLTHVLDKLQLLDSPSMTDTGSVVKAMREDVTREAEGEVVMSAEALRAIGKKAARLFKALVTSQT